MKVRSFLALISILTTSSAMAFDILPDVSRNKSLRPTGFLSSAWETKRVEVGAQANLLTSNEVNSEYIVFGPDVNYANELFNIKASFRRYETDYMYSYNSSYDQTSTRTEFSSLNTSIGLKPTSNIVVAASVSKNSSELLGTSYKFNDSSWKQTQSEIDNTVISTGLSGKIFSNYYLGASVSFHKTELSRYTYNSDSDSSYINLEGEGKSYKLGLGYISDSTNSKVELTALAYNEIENDSVVLSLTGAFKSRYVEFIPSFAHATGNEDVAIGLDLDTSITENIYIIPGASYNTNESGAGHLAFGYRHGLVNAQADVARGFETEVMSYTLNLKYNL